jgi:hypothetical protein
METRFQTLQWLFPVVVTLHNTEEAIWLPAWSQRAGYWYSPVEQGVFRFAALVLVLLAFLVTYLSFRGGRQSIWTYLTFGYMVAMLANAFLPHIVASAVLRSYTPGLATALLNVAVLSPLLRLAVKEGFVSGWKAVAYSLAVPAFLLISLRPLFQIARTFGL